MRDREGNFHLFSESALRADEVLLHYEKEYVELIIKIIERLRFYKKDLNDPHNQCGLILGLVEGEIIKLVRRGALWSTLREDTINNTFIHYAYIFYRSLRHFKNGVRRSESIAGRKSRNDFEDANICRHLRVDTPFHLITNDKNFYEAINQVKFLAKNVEPKIKTLLEVSKLSHLKELACKKRSRALNDG